MTASVDIQNGLCKNYSDSFRVTYYMSADAENSAMAAIAQQVSISNSVLLYVHRDHKD